MRSQTSKQLPNLPLAPDGKIDPSGDIGQATIRCCVSQCGPGLRSIILTGSMARNEGSYGEQEGHIRVMGDAEFV
jgi:hypothetical protein